MPVWGWSSNPLVDGDKIICLVGGEKQAVVAFDREDGKVLWSALTTEEVGYAPPTIFEIGGKRQLIVWHSESVNSSNPETGEPYWRRKVPARRPSRTPGRHDRDAAARRRRLVRQQLLPRPVRPEARSKGAEGERPLAGEPDDARKVKGLRA